VVVENRAGAAGNIGTEIAAKAPPDGYTLVTGNNATFGANVSLYKKLGFDPIKDFAPVVLVASQPNVLVVHPSLPVTSVKGLIAFARARPGEIAYASTGTGSYTHLTMALFLQMTGTRMLEVNYKGGGPAVIGLAAGETQVFFVGIGSVMAGLQSGRLRALGVASEKRLKAFPDVPTVAEAGVPGYELTAWIGSFVPSATPRATVERLNAEITKAVQHPDVVKILGAQALDPMIMTVDEFAQRLKQDYDKYENLIKATGARADSGA
jgi:tripartite-type tricarboxylate transporter receptor subunit TctC